MPAIRPRIDVSPDPEALARRVAQWIADLACHSAGRFAVCLSGGSTPRRLYQLLAAPPLRDVMPWQRVHWFWGDERFVPWDHPDSNYGMAREAMLAHVPVSPGNIHGIAFPAPLPEPPRPINNFRNPNSVPSRLIPRAPPSTSLCSALGPTV